MKTLGRSRIRSVWLAILVAFILPLVAAACGSPEEREARHLSKGIEYFEAGNDDKAMVEFRNALRINPKNAETLYHVGLLHERAQRWPQAFGAFQAATAERAGYIDANLKLGTLGLMSGNIDIAEKSARAILEAHPNNIDGRVLDAASMLRNGDLQRAQEVSLSVLESNPEHENAIAVLVGVLQARGRSDEALATLDDKLVEIPKSISLRILKIAILEQQQNLDKVSQVYEELIALSPDDPGYRLALSDFLTRKADFDGAEIILREAIDGNIATSTMGQALAVLLYREKGFEAAKDALEELLASDPDNFHFYFTMAEMMSREGMIADAEEFLDKVIEIGDLTASEDAKAAKARLRLIQEDLFGARTLTEEVLDENSEHRGANFVRGLVQLQSGEYDEAIRSGRAALRRDPTWIPGLKIVSEAHLRRNEIDLAIDTLNTIATVDPSDAAAGETLAQLLMQRGDFDASLKIWNGLLERGSDPAKALQARARIRMQQQNWSAAQSDVDALLAMPDQELAGSLLAGDLMVAQDQLAQGRQWFDKALAIEPNAQGALLGFVRTFVAQGDIDTALEFLTERTATHPDDALAYNMLGELQARKDAVTESGVAFRRAIELKPSWATPYRQLARLHRTNNNIVDAIAIYEEALKNSPDHLPILRDLASTLLSDKRFVEAIDVYKKISNLDSDDDLSVNNYAALIADHQFDNVDLLNNALDVAQRFRTSDNGWFLDTLGWLHYRKGDYAVATTFLERATNYLPANPQIRYHLGMALKASGLEERARIELERAVDGVDSYDGLEEAKDALAELRSSTQTSTTDG